MIIDSHIHLWDHVDGQLGNSKVSAVANGVIKVGAKKVQGMPSWFTDCKNPAELALAAFDDAGVNAAVVTQEFLDGNQNSYLAKVSKKYPERFFVHGLLDFRRPAVLKKQFSQVFKQGFRGIKCPAMPLPDLEKPVELDSPELMIIWEQMQAEKMILSIDLAAGDVQVSQMKNVIKTFPKLKIAIGHFGMVGHGKWKEQIKLARSENVYIECGGIIWLFRHEGPKFPGAQRAVKTAMHLVGAEKIMWGSDYPRTMVDFTYRQSLQFAKEGCSFFTDRDRNAFLGGNAKRLYCFKTQTQLKPRVLITQ